MRLLHAIHDFLPRHRAGSEIYAFELASELSRRHDVFVVAAEYDPGVPHGTIRWREHGGLPVVEIVNNWAFESFDETWSPERINAQLRHVLRATRPDVLHVHNLLNLSFDLPRIAREAGVPSVATLHDYTLVCPSGGQRVHAADSHVCHEIEPDRCSRCFRESPFHAQLAAGRILRRSTRVAGIGDLLRRVVPTLARRAADRLPASVTAAQIRRRLSAARNVFDTIDLFVAPSRALGLEYVRLGVDPARLDVADYGFRPARPPARTRARGGVRFGFVGTLVWHKGVHVLVEALRGVPDGWELEIWGDPTVFPDYSAELQRQTTGLPIRFAGAFDRDDLADVYGGLDALIVPSVWPENSPLVIHEAFQHGVPVVAARAGGIVDLVTDGLNGLLYDPFSVEALRAALGRLVTEDGLVHRFARNVPPVRSIAEDALDWERRYAAVSASPGLRAVTI